jgi:hypothetical protein
VDIAEWLRGLGLEKYAPAFDENAINWDVLSELTTDTLPFPDVPCSKTPPQSPAIIANSDRLLLPSRYSTLSACGCRLTRLNRFTCVTACPSLCLRLAHVVTSISPRLDFRWGGFTPCRRGNLTRWKRQAWPGAPK